MFIQLNIDLAYDDFGAGQARLLELIEVPVKYVKFDIALIRGLPTATEARLLHPSSSSPYSS